MKVVSICAALLALPVLAQAQDWAAVSTLFQGRCVACHSGEFAPLGLQLDTYATVMRGSENGAVVIPGQVQDSPIYQRITGQAEPRMPLDGPPFLDADQIAKIADWIAAGAPQGAGGDAPRAKAVSDPRADGRILYSEVSRIFGQACIKCHSDNGIMGRPPEALRLDSYSAILAGGERVAVIPGNAQASEVYRRIQGLARPRMPFDGPPWLDDADIALLKDWIDGGALSDDGEPAPIPVGSRVRLRGVMTGPSAIDGASFVVTGNTRVDERPAIGQQAEVRARVGANGQLIAERLRDR